MAKLCKLTTGLKLTSLSLLAAFSPMSIAVNNSQFGVSLPLTISNGSAIAQQIQQYVPPGGSRPQRTVGSGARGCTNSIPVTLNLLTPQNHTARTTLSRPTFLWHVSQATTVPMVFTLSAQGSNQPVFQKELKADKAGIVRLEMPQEAPELASGKEYRWTVVLVCNAKRPSQNINARAWIERVATTPELSRKLAKATDERDRAFAYAQSSIWYDAVAILSQLQSNNPRESQATEAFVSLLDQVGLTKVATMERQR